MPKLPHTECAGYSEVPLASDGQTGATGEGEGEGERSVRRAATDPKFRATGFPFRHVGNMGRGGRSARAVGPAAGCRKLSQTVGVRAKDPGDDRPGRAPAGCPKMSRNVPSKKDVIWPTAKLAGRPVGYGCRSGASTAKASGTSS